MCADLVELPMHVFDVFLSMDLLQSFYACLDYHSRVVRFHFPNEEQFLWKGYNSSLPNPLISNLKAYKMMSKGLQCHLLSDNDLDHEIPSIDLVPIVNEFLDVFPEDLSGVPPL